MNNWLYKQFLSSYLCGCRKDYNRQLALSSLIKKWEKVLDNKSFGVVVLMNLSKAFDKIDHDLLSCKTSAVGF